MKSPKSRSLIGMSLYAFFAANPVLAGTGWFPIASIDSLDPIAGVQRTFVSLAGYSNPSCDADRILIETTNVAHHNKMISMLLLAMASHSNVDLSFTVSDGQCRSNRVIVYSP